MEDLWRSIKAFLYERSTSPLGGAFVISWFVFNYRVLVILFSGDHYNDNFAAIDEYFYFELISNAHLINSLAGKFLCGIVGPAVLTTIYLFAYPMIAAPVYKITLSQRKRLREIKQKADNARLLTADESRQLIKRLDELDEEHKKETDRLNRRITDLQETNSELESEIINVSNAPRNADSSDTDIDGASDESGLERFDDQMENAISDLDDGDFLLSDLFSSEAWESLLTVERQGLGKRFRSKVNRGDFLGVKFKERNASNQAVYTKSTRQPSGQNQTPTHQKSGFTRIEKSEMEDFKQSIEKRDLNVDDFKLVEHDFEATKTGIHALTGTVTITFQPTAVSKQYKTGHGSTWPFLFDTDLDRGAFHKS